MTLFHPQSTSLFQLLHADVLCSKEDQPENLKPLLTLYTILKDESIQTRILIKYEIAFYLAQAMFTIQNLNSVKTHGHLTSHNVYVDIKKLGVAHFSIKVRIADFETYDFMVYSNMFFDYRVSSVWSAPEALEKRKEIQPKTVEMDTYSFGLILWELWHQAIPFDNDVSQAAKYVVKENSRPKIIHNLQELKELNGDDEDENEDNDQKEELPM